MIPAVLLRLCRRLGPKHFATVQCRQLCTDSQQQSSSGILDEYHRLVAEGEIQADPTQLAAVSALQLLQDGLVLKVKSRFLQQHKQQQQQAHDAGASTQGQHGIDSNAPSSTHSDGSSPSSSSSRSSSSSSSSSIPHVQGAYLWGPVGSGKTMLMDLFLKTLPPISVSQDELTAPPPGAAVMHSGSSSSSSLSALPQHVLRVETERLHFHTFMLGVHQQLHQLQQSLPKVVMRSRAGLPVHRHALPPVDPILVVARSAAASTDLLCLDELHVTDVADAMLLSRLFGELLACGCAVVFTSNRPPRDLYKGGLSRRYFEPFIHLVDNSLLQLRVAGGQDYRTAAAQQQSGTKQADSAGIWFVGPDSGLQLQRQWQQLAQKVASTVQGPSNIAVVAATAAAAAVGAPAHIPLPFSRSLWVPKAIRSVHQQQLSLQQVFAQQDNQQQQLAGAYFTFEQLCGNSGSRPSLATAGTMSANDYLALVQSCRHLFVEGVPQLQPSQRDEARRLVTLVDLLYEEHTLTPGAVKLCVSAEVPPHELFLPLLGAAARQGVNPNLGRSSNKLDVKALIEAKASKPAAAPVQGSAVAGEDATAGGRPGKPKGSAAPSPASWPTAQSGSDAGQASSSAAGQQPARAPAPPPALLAEEVLMYHRASSRLVELCSVTAVGS